MEEEATQPGMSQSSSSRRYNAVPPERADDPYWVATQLIMDPRRYGQQNSGMSSEDLADVFCILHPITMAACTAVSRIHDKTPEYTTKASWSGSAATQPDDVNSPASFDLAQQGLTPCNLALRLSGHQRSPQGGYMFGRHKTRCDFDLGSDDPKRRISNMHFRIFIIAHGIIMVEDSSTNGILVNNTLLRKGIATVLPRRTLSNGDIISFVPAKHGEDVIKFICRIPNRDGLDEDFFNDNLAAYLTRLRDGQLLRGLENADATAKIQKAGEAPDIFGKENGSVSQIATPTPAVPSVQRRPEAERSRKHKDWRGGSKYNKLKMIGRGAFASVYLVVTKMDGVAYACKELEKRRFIKDGILDQKIENEMRIMSKVKHPNVVQLIEHFDYYEYYYLILEYVPIGDLGSYLAREQRCLKESEAKLMTVQLLSALEYLHNNGITHRDIKPENILVDNEAPFRVKLTDFGLSKMAETSKSVLTTFCGTLLYCAPEVYTEYKEYDNFGKRTRGKFPYLVQQYSSSVDIWSLGAVLFFCLCGSAPFPAVNGTTHQQLLNTIMTQDLDVRPLSEAKISREAATFLKAMLHRDPQRRATVWSCRQQDWLRSEGVRDEFPVAIESDEVDMLGDDSIPDFQDEIVDDDDELEQKASQLSVNENKENENYDMEEDVYTDDDDLDAVTPTRYDLNMEIPSSFPSADSASTEDEGFNFGGTVVDVGKRRLFGEIDPAALRSSGVIAPDHLNLPLPGMNLGQNQNQESEIIADDQSNSVIHNPQGQQSVRRIGPPSDMSLFGAESMVNNLAMASPSPAATDAPSPQILTLDHPATTFGNMPPPQTKSRAPIPNSDRDLGEPASGVTPAHSMTGSVLGRRQARDVSDDTSGNPQSKRPATDRAVFEASNTNSKQDVPIPSTETQPEGQSEEPKPFSRRITGIYSEKVHWDPRDRSTHVFTGRHMTDDEFNQMNKEALKIGTTAYSNSPSFATLLNNLHSRRSQSAEAERVVSRPQSEPGVRPRTGDGTSEVPRGSPPFRGATVPVNANHAFILDAALIEASTQPEATRDSITPSRASTPQALAETYENVMLAPSPRPADGIIARLYTTANSSMPPLALPIMSHAFIWGRGSDTTVRYWDLQDTRVPKYALKLVYLTGESDDSFANYWYVLASRGYGLRINDVDVFANGGPGVNAPDRNQVWLALQNNDKIQFWGNKDERYGLVGENAFIFQCFVGVGAKRQTYLIRTITNAYTQQRLWNQIQAEFTRARMAYEESRLNYGDTVWNGKQNPERLKFEKELKIYEENWVGTMRKRVTSLRSS